MFLIIDENDNPIQKSKLTDEDLEYARDGYCSIFSASSFFEEVVVTDDLKTQNFPIEEIKD
jgi:hypothetical protein